MKKQSKPRVLIWDTETTNLNATFGTLLCIGYKWLGNKTVKVPTIFDFSKIGNLDDAGLVKHFANIYNSADYTVTHYGKRFDLPFVETKLMRYGEPPLKPTPMIDTWKTARYKLKLHNNRLASLAGYLKVEHSKTAISFDDWLQAAHGNRKAMREVVHHCKMDVLVLEEVFLKMRPWITEEPTRRLLVDGVDMGGCTRCGSMNFTRQGFKIARTRKYQQFKCSDCGTWFKSNRSEPLPKIKGGAVTALAKQVGGRHYKDLVIQPFEYVFWNGLGGIEHSIIKYVTRWRRKGGVEDLEKAKHSLEILIELAKKEQEQNANRSAESSM